jgi:hypothetical protein
MFTAVQFNEVARRANAGGLSPRKREAQGHITWPAAEQVINAPFTTGSTRPQAAGV